ncbi:MAG: hypothetical protein PWP31_70 [Clostridia bacterium]|nr:hypothetical protein [Clostridia bacterium]
MRTVKWQKGGFTLLEAVLSACLMAIVMTAALSILGNGLKWWQHSWDSIDAQQNARVALERMVNEISCAKTIVNGSNEEVLILEDGVGNQFKYQLDGTNLQKAVKNKGSLSFGGYNLLAYGVKDLKFTYSQPDNPENSKVVTIHIVTTDEKEEQDFSITTSVALRLKVMK